MKLHFKMLLIAALPGLTSSCGQDLQEKSSFTATPAVKVAITDFFTPAQQKSLMGGAEPELVGGTDLSDTNPVALRLLAEFQGDKPGEVSAVSELRAFLPAPSTSLSSEDAAQKLMGVLRNVSRWTSIRDSEGNALYREVKLIKGPTSVPATAGDIPLEDRFVQVKMKMFGASPYVIHHQVIRSGGIVLANTVNDQGVTAVGVTAVKARGSRGLVAYFPVKGGWLVYSLNGIKLEGLARSAESPESLGNKNLGAFNFVAESLR
jgi:hypothetical protein